MVDGIEPIRLLYMEDDHGLARLLQTRLRRQGYAVDVVDRGEEGLARLASYRYDLTIVDYRMPGMDGIEVLDRMRGTDGDGSGVPSIMVTGAGDERVAVEAMKRGAEDYIVKDTEGNYLDLLPSVIERTLVRQRLQLAKDAAEEALQRSEERYRSLVEHAPYAIVVFVDKHLAFVNAAAIVLLGASSSAELLGQPIARFLHPERAMMVIDQALRQQKEGGEAMRVEDELTPLVGDTRIVELGGTAVTFRGHAAVQVFMRDITAEKRAEEDRRRSAARLKEALVQTVQVVALTIEKRDPFTAGHQRRVAQLAASIAREMGLPEDRIDGLTMGALIHDIGKIYVPTAILNRPGTLSKVELDLIRAHAQVGYDIVKDVELPWPVAEMVFQHHERIDGSGYPRGLVGDTVLLEARIICIADVVEAMASHRPYRPSLGLESALAELEHGAGTLYDANIVRACTRLFRDQAFQFV